MIGVSFYLVTTSTIRLVGDSLFADTVKTGMTSAAELSAMPETPDYLYRITKDALDEIIAM